MRGGNRGTNQSSRFGMDYEANSMYEGIAEELGGTVGQQVDWFRWQDYYVDANYTSVVDDIYDTSSGVSGQGRRWMLPFKLPTVMAQLIRSSNVMNERGFYVTDTLRLVVNVGDIQRLIPEMMSNPSSHIKDRILYMGEIYTPTRVLPRGSFGMRWAVVTIDCNQVNPEELVDDPQFQRYAEPATVDRRSSVVTLKSLAVTNYALVPSFNPTITSYTLAVGSTESKVLLTPVAASGMENIIMIDGTLVKTGLTASVPLMGTTTITNIVVSTDNSPASQTYKVTITKGA